MEALMRDSSKYKDLEIEMDFKGNIVCDWEKQ